MADDKDALASDFAPFATPRWMDVIEVSPGHYHCAVCGQAMGGAFKSALTDNYATVWCDSSSCANYNIRLRHPLKRTSLQVDE